MLEANSLKTGARATLKPQSGGDHPRRTGADERAMHILAAYLEETGDTPQALARRVGVDATVIEALIAGAEAPLALAERIVAACDGAIAIADLTTTPVFGGASMFARNSATIDAEQLRRLLAPELAALLGGARRAGDHVLARLAAEAAANTYLALSVTGWTGADRLALALEPVLKEILADFQFPPQPLEETARRIASTYFQAPQASPQ